MRICYKLGACHAVSVALLIILTVGLAGCDNKNSNSTAAGRGSSGQSAQSMPASEAKMCNLLAGGQANVSQIKQQLAGETNPIRQSEIQAQLEQVEQDFRARMTDFLLSNAEIHDFVGTVKSLENHSLSAGTTLDLAVDFPCNIIFHFFFQIDFEPAFGGAKDDQMSLERWQGTLVNLHSGDSVSFSTRIDPASYANGWYVEGPALLLFGKLINLRKN